MNPKVDFYFTKTNKWQNEVTCLRTLVLDCGLSEELKWGVPCYLFHNRNIVLIHTFKEYCALLFFKGALLHDKSGILVQQTANVQSARQIRFTSVQEISAMETVVRNYIYEAVEVEKAGLKVDLKKASNTEHPGELLQKFRELPALKTAFNKLTPGRQRGYVLYFSAAKQTTTRTARIDKSITKILAGRGLDDD